MTTITFEERLLVAGAEQAHAAALEAGAQGEQLIAAWVQHKNAAAVAAVADGSTPLRKAARRALNVLKARGVSVPEKSRTVAALVPKEEKQEEAWMLTPDGAGTFLLAVAAREPSSRYDACFLFLNHELGLGRIERTRLGAADLKRTMAGFLRDAEHEPVKVPVPWARQVIAATRAKHVARGVPEPLGLASAKELLEPLPSEPQPHPFDEEGLVVADEDVDELSTNSGQLHVLPEFRGWFPPDQVLQELLLEVGSKLTPGQEPSQELISELMENAVKATTDRWFSPERRELVAIAMKDSALSVLARAGETEALRVAATLRKIERCGLITDPPHEVPFLRGYFDKAISVMLSRGGGKLTIPIPSAQPSADS